MSSRASGPHPGRVRDAALAGSVLLVSLGLAHRGLRPEPGVDGHLDLIGAVLAAGTALPLLAWRRRPLAVFVVTAAAGALLAGLGYPYEVDLGAAVALYLLAAGRAPGASWPATTTLVVVGAFLAYVGAAAAAGGGFPGSELLHSGLAWAVAWFAGERTRLRRAEVAELHERAERAERDARREALLAAAEERARIARDLHDAAGSAVSVIAVRAGAARLRHHQDPDRSLAALEAIEELARRIADDIDHIVGTLRSTDAGETEVEPPAGLASLDSLVSHHRLAGLDVTVDVAGGGGPLGGAVGGAVDQAVYRVLQESLTNAARHGAGSAHVDIAVGDAAVELTVTNPVARPAVPRPAGGHGIVGMRERATLLGGELHAERVDGSFRLLARIPHRGPAG